MAKRHINHRDPGGRSSRFHEYLSTLPKSERDAIRKAEAAFLEGHARKEKTFSEVFKDSLESYTEDGLDGSKAPYSVSNPTLRRIKNDSI